MSALPFRLKIGCPTILVLLALWETAHGAKPHRKHGKKEPEIVAAPLPAQPAVSPPSALPAANPTQLEVKLLSPRDGAEFNTSEILVKVAVRVPQGESLLGIRAMVDGRLAARARGGRITMSGQESQEAGQQMLLAVPVPTQDFTLSILAEGTQAKSQPISARLKWAGTLADKVQAEQLQPKLYMLSIGISAYQRTDLRLGFAAKDAVDLTAVFRSQQKTLYRAVGTRLLVDKDASKGNILDGLQWLKEQTTSRDVAVVFLAGHGVTDPSSGVYYFLPYDADPGAMMRTMLPETDVRTALANIPGKVLLFLDTCHSGKVFGASQNRGFGDIGSFITELSSAENGVIVFAAATGRQASQEAPEWSNGAFTRAAIEGLQGRADVNHTGRVTLNMLDLYISERVKALTGGRQTPTTAKPATIPDFPIAVIQEIGNEDIEVAR